MKNMIFLFIIIGLLFIVNIIQYFLNSKKIKILSLSKIGPIQTSFDPLIASGKGLDEINRFIRICYLKFINSKLISLNEESETPITSLLSILSSDKEMSSLTIGFVTYVSASMSKELKIFFNKYYNVLDNTGDINEIYVKYLSDWFILNIRELQAEMSSLKAENEDYSISTEIKRNAEIFMNIELRLYRELNLVEQNEKQ